MLDYANDCQLEARDASFARHGHSSVSITTKVAGTETG